VGEAVGKKKDGSTFPQELSLSLLSDSKLICVVRNISVRKRAEREIYDKSLFLQTIIDTCPYPIFFDILPALKDGDSWIVAEH